jgi:hypothetical protein
MAYGNQKEWIERDLGDEEHAIYAVAKYLDVLKLGQWCGVVINWLGQFDGLERYALEENWPVMEVRDMLASYVGRGQPMHARELVKELVALPFVLFCAKQDLMPGRWNPLETTFIEYEYSGKQILVYEAEKPYPARECTEHYLYDAFVRVQETGTSVV